VPRHRFDPVALVFGIVFVAAGVIVLAGGELIDEGRALVPAGLIALGIAVLVHVGRRPRPSAPAGTAADETEADNTEVVDPTEVDITEVVDPTERYPRSEPE
jgi:hypothetical protein